MKLLAVSSIAIGDNKGKIFYVYTDEFEHEKNMITAYYIKKESETGLWKDCDFETEIDNEEDSLFHLFKAIKDSLLEFSTKVGFIAVNHPAEEVKIAKEFENCGIEKMLTELANNEKLIESNYEEDEGSKLDEDSTYENRRSLSC